MATRQVAYLCVLCVVFSGCARSDRSLDLPEGTLTVERPMQIEPIGAMPMAFSSDGNLMALAYEAMENRVTVEVRDIDTDETLYVQCLPEDSVAYPVLFRHDLRALYCIGEEGVVEMELESGELRRVPQSPDPLRMSGQRFFMTRNFDQSAVALPSERGAVALNNRGEILGPADEMILFDEFGNAWARDARGWTRMNRRGGISHHTVRPPYLVQDQTALRGATQLVTESSTLTRKGATAHLTTVWLDHTRARGSKRSALVFAGPDVYRAGFVPKRDMVWIACDDGGFLISLITER